MSRAPLVVENGEAVTKPSPFHSGRRWLGSGGGCRTTTALADPVVPEVYMMSLVSPSPSGRGRGVESACTSAQFGPRLPGIGRDAGQDHGGLGMVDDPPQLGAGQPGVHRDRHRPGPV